MSKVQIKNLNDEGGNSILVTPYEEVDREKKAVDSAEKVLSPGEAAEFEIETGKSGVDLQDVGQDAANAGDAGDAGNGDDGSAGGEAGGEENKDQAAAA